jgi:hypothetical protein
LQDKEGKVAYLTKIIAVVSMALNELVAAKPLKVRMQDVAYNTGIHQQRAAAAAAVPKSGR